jgi:hypothetical protein
LLKESSACCRCPFTAALLVAILSASLAADLTSGDRVTRLEQLRALLLELFEAQRESLDEARRIIEDLLGPEGHSDDEDERDKDQQDPDGEQGG